HPREAVPLVAGASGGRVDAVYGGGGGEIENRTLLLVLDAGQEGDVAGPCLGTPGGAGGEGGDVDGVVVGVGVGRQGMGVGSGAVGRRLAEGGAALCDAAGLAAADGDRVGV